MLICQICDFVKINNADEIYICTSKLFEQQKNGGTT